MKEVIKVGIVGLDTSHSVEFVKRMQAPDCPADQRVTGMMATACMRFETPFQNRTGLDTRQKQLESWGVRVTTSFDEAVAGCDAIMLEINDASYHLEYFRKCLSLGKPVFLDKPLADTIKNVWEIVNLAAAAKLNFISCSSLRFVPDIDAACARVTNPAAVSLFGPLGKAPAGSSIVWYGVHAFEMLVRIMGCGASSVTAVKTSTGVVCIVDYADTRRGVIELTEGNWSYGGTLRGRTNGATAFVADTGRSYTLMLMEIEKFFRTGIHPFQQAETVEITALLDAATEAAESGLTLKVNI